MLVFYEPFVAQSISCEKGFKEVSCENFFVHSNFEHIFPNAY